MWILGFCQNDRFRPINIEDDLNEMIGTKPYDADGYIDRLYDEIAADTEVRETVTFVQFADAHLDLRYLEGSTADCGAVYCCRQETETGKGSIKAGKWGT